MTPHISPRNDGRRWRRASRRATGDDSAARRSCQL